MTAPYATVMAELARARQRELRDEVAGARRSRSLRQSIGRALINWGIRLAPDARTLIRSGASR
jgi:hypothetical protein